MAINTTTRQTTAFTSGQTFAFAFKVYEEGDVKVIRITNSTGAEEVLTITNHYTVTLNDDQNANPGGSITLVSSGNPVNLGSGFSIVITSKVTPLQQTEITNQGGFFPEVINDVLDKAAILDQQQQAILDKTIRFPLTQTVGGLEITENAANRAGKIVQFDGSGDLAILGTVDGRDVSADGAKLDTIETNAKDDQTAAEIRALVESASDSNVFTDADHSKLNGIEAGATADLTASEIKALYESNSNTNVLSDAQVSKLAGIEAGATGDQSASEIRTLVGSANDSNVFTDNDHTKLDGIEANAINASNSAITNKLPLAGGTITGNLEVNNNLSVGSRLRLSKIGEHVYLDNIHAANSPQSDLYIRNNVGSGIDHSGDIYIQAKDGEGGITVADDGAVILYFDGILQATTTNLGFAIDDNLIPVSDNAKDLGIASLKWRNLYLDGGIIGDAIVKSGTSNSDSKFYSAKRAGEIFYQKDTLSEIISTEQWSASDDKVATTAAIDARILDLVDEVGGFVPIANETSFPTANPDAENGTGTIVSVKAASTDLTPSGTTVTIANGAGTGNTVTITGVPSVISSGFGFLVETTTTLHTYTFHRLTPKATEVTTVAANATQVQTVHNNINQVQTVHNNITDIQAVAADASDIGAVAGKATEIGLLGTSAVITDMGLLGNSGVIADMNLLATSDVITDMNLLATSDVIADMALLAVPDVISDMNDLATSANITAMSTCSTNISSITNASNNISSVNNFGDKYQIASNDPSTDGGGNALAVGDLYFNTSANELKIYNGSSWQAGVTATGNFALTTGNTFTGDNRYNDNVKLKLGTGSDLEIFHNNNVSVLKNTAGDQLNLRSDLTWLRNAANSESLAKFNGNGAAELYYDNSKKLETTSSGVQITGNVNTDGNITIASAAPNLLFTESDANPDFGILLSAGQLKFQDTTNTANILTLDDDKIQAVVNLDALAGVDFNDNVKARFGTGNDLEIYHSGSHSIIAETGTGILYLGGNQVQLYGSSTNDILLKAVENGAVELYYDNAKKLETVNTGVNLTGGAYATGTITAGSNIKANTDGGKLTSGASDDLQIYHDGTLSYIKNNTAKLVIRSDTFQFGTADGTHRYIDIPTDEQGVSLFYDDSKKFETTSAGAKVNGEFLVEGNLKRLFIKDTNGTGGNARPGIVMQDSAASNQFFIGNGGVGSTELTLINYTDASIGFRTNNTLRLEIDNNGHVQIPADNAKLQIGASQDLEIYHDGTNSYIDNHTGELYLRGNGDDIFLKAVDTKDSLRCRPNGSVDLFYNDSTKFQTTDTGFEGFGGQFRFNGVEGGAAQLLIYADEGDDANDKWRLMANTDATFILGTLADGSWDTALKAHGDGQVELYYNDVKKFETTSAGAQVTGDLEFDDNNKVIVGTGNDGLFYHDGYDTILRNTTGNLRIVSDNIHLEAGDFGDEMLRCLHDGAVELYYDNSKKFETRSNGGKITGSLEIEGGTAQGNHDATLYVTADNNNDWGLIVDYGTGSSGKSEYGAKIVSRTGSTHAFSIAQVSGGSHAEAFLIDGDGNVDKVGHITPRGNNSFDLGSTSLRWRNVYTHDLNLSNEGGSNDVDGTWGSYTIQEGAEDLFLVNKRNGKKYKFNLTEVS